MNLLAKSPRSGRELTLVQHLADTEEAGRALFREGSRWGTSYLRFFKLGTAAHPRFLLNLRVACLFHDIGKANEGFLDAVTAKRFVAQSLRHEHLSAVILAHPAIRTWLTRCPDVDLDVVIAAVLTHHLKATHGGKWPVLSPLHNVPTQLYLYDPQVVNALERVASLIEVELPSMDLPRRYDDAGWKEAEDWFWERRVPRFTRELAKDAERLALHLAVKAGLIAADSVASAMFRVDQSVENWVEGVAHAEALAPDAVQRDIIGPRIDEIRLSREFKEHQFQKGAAQVGRRALLLAGCGAGKTLAAWKWADSVARTEPIGRVIFLYPTRGTATEGFRDYVGHAPEGTSALVHGTAEYELRGMQSNGPDLPRSLQGKDFVPDESEARLFSLGLWSKKYFSATVDQFLSFIENGYGGICLLPALADAAIVFDEVHSYDARMWNALVSFLRKFDVPVLCMTATLAETRRKELAGLLRVYPSETERQDLQDLEAAEKHPRYRIEAVADADAALRVVVDEVRAGRRALWVVNTVRRCQQLARRLENELDTVHVYHSRFKLAHRQAHHRATIAAFQAPTAGEPLPAVAVTTQVCEMSLDLDADVLVTEHAPISSIVQRFGRANRHLRRGREFRARILTYAPESNLPYEKSELDASASFLASFADREVSQRDLAEGLATHSPAGRFSSGEVAFLDGGYFAAAGALRDDDEAGAPVILDRDLPTFRELERARKPTDGLRLTVPRKFAHPANDPGLPTWLQLADAERYDDHLGFVVDDDMTGGTR